jgi:hypothetical protein
MVDPAAYALFVRGQIALSPGMVFLRASTGPTPAAQKYLL